MGAMGGMGTIALNKKAAAICLPPPMS